MRMDFFKKIFYPSTYLSLSASGIDISNRSIKYVEFLNNNGELALKNYGEIPLPDDTIKDGVILNRDALVKALVELRKKISTTFVKVSIPEEKTYIFNTQIIRDPAVNIREAIEFKLEENVPLKVDEVDFEYDIINKGETNGNILVSVSVIQKKLIDDFQVVFSLAGIYPVSFEIESRMLSKSVVIKRDHRAFMIINIKGDSTSMSYLVDGIVRFSSTITVGEHMIRTSLMKIDPSFYDEAGNFSGKNIAYDIEHNSELHQSLSNIFSIIKDEVDKFNSYILSKADNNSRLLPEKIEKVILCGNSATLPGFANHIGQNINTEVVLGDVWINAFDLNKYLPSMQFRDSLRFATAVGLALPSFKK